MLAHNPAQRLVSAPAHKQDRARLLGNRRIFGASVQQCHGLIAASCNIRHTVLRLIFLPGSVSRLRRTRSASDCRLRGSFVSAIVSQAMAWINAWSSGGKSGFAAAPRMVFDREIASGPATAPTLHLPQRKSHRLGSVFVPQGWLLMKEQREAKALNDLNRRGSSTNGVECLLHEIVGEVTTSRLRTWHSGFLSCWFFRRSSLAHQRFKQPAAALGGKFARFFAES